jgi:hypothetical protein
MSFFGFNQLFFRGCKVGKTPGFIKMGLFPRVFIFYKNLTIKILNQKQVQKQRKPPGDFFRISVIAHPCKTPDLCIIKNTKGIYIAISAGNALLTKSGRESEPNGKNLKHKSNFS